MGSTEFRAVTGTGSARARPLPSRHSLPALIAVVLVVLSIGGLARVETARAAVAVDSVESGLLPAPEGPVPALENVPLARDGGARAAYDMGDHDGYWAGWWVVGPLMMVLFWGGVIVIAIWAIRQFSGGRERTPLDIAKERLARGEISKEEFERIRDDLT